MSCEQDFKNHLRRFGLSEADAWLLVEELANEVLTDDQVKCLQRMGVNIPSNPKVRKQPEPPSTFETSVRNSTFGSKLEVIAHQHRNSGTHASYSEAALRRKG